MIRTALLILVKLILVTALLAQNSDHLLLYATFSPLYLSGATTGEVPSGFLSASDQTGNLWAPGIGGGFTWNFVRVSSLTFGLDLRGSTKPGTPGADTAMIGFTLAGRPAHSPVRPYGQVSFGYLGSRAHDTTPPYSGNGPAPSGSFSSEYVAFEVFGGVDYSLRQHLDLRVIELGVGGGSEFSLFVTNPSHPVLFNLNTGAVFHF
jgi:hypothetical protein